MTDPDRIPVLIAGQPIDGQTAARVNLLLERYRHAQAVLARWEGGDPYDIRQFSADLKCALQPLPSQEQR